MKKTIILLLVGIMCFGIHFSACADEMPEFRNIKISVNDKKIILLNAEDEQLKSIVSDGIIYIPIESFITALEGEYSYDAANNQIIIRLSAGSSASVQEDTLSSGNEYSEDAISALLISGRWTMEQEGGVSFIDFNADHTGLISSTISCSWTISGKIVTLDYTSQNQDFHLPLQFEVNGSTIQLTHEDGMLFILGGSSDPVMDILGTWHLRGDESSTLAFQAGGAFEMKLNGLTYKGEWSYSNNQIMMTQKGISIFGDYNGTSIGLKINGKVFTFIR